MSDPVMAAAEQRWAERVVGTRTPLDAPHSRFADGPIEANFLMQLRSIYKLVIEWRRRENGLSEDDPSLVDGEEDPWVNGADEFAAMVALYLRYVIKSGCKDGYRHADELVDPEDSNHLWSRLVCYFSERHEALLECFQGYLEADHSAREEAELELIGLLQETGIRKREEGFDGRHLFAFPSNYDGFDLLLIQKESTTLADLLDAAEERLGIPREHFRQFIVRYKEFKHHENPYPIHPFILEAAKLLPHFVLMALLGIIWYNHETGGLSVVPFLGDALRDLVSLRSLYWAIPLALGGALEAMARSRLRNALTNSREDDPAGPLHSDPTFYRSSGYVLRGAAFLALGLEVFAMPVPSFAAFLLLKGVVGTLILLESAAIFIPLAASLLSRGLQERSLRRDRERPLTRFLNQLNIPISKPCSVI